MRKFLTALMAILLAANVVFAQQSKSDETLEYRPHWGIILQGGAAYTLGEASFSNLISPAAQISASYNFHHAMGVRFGLDGWQGKGSIVAPGEIYRFRFIQLHADYVLDLANLFGGFKHDRIWTPYIFAGIGGAFGFDNKEASAHVAEYGEVVSKYWESAPFLAVRAGAGVDFWVSKNVAIGVEVNANGYSDKFNSKASVPKSNPDFNFNALAGVKIRFGGNTRPSKAYAAKKAAEEAELLALAEAERLAAEKAEAERLAAEKAKAERLAAEKAEAERLAAERAAAIAAERAALAAENSGEIFFTIGSYKVRKNESGKLEKLAAFMNEHTDFTVVLVGYADKATGTPVVNLKISEKRANIVKERLVALGVPSERIIVDFKGDTVQPFAENDKNRVIIYTLQ